MTRLAERTSRIASSATMAVTATVDKLRRAGVAVIDFGAGEPDFDVAVAAGGRDVGLVNPFDMARADFRFRGHIDPPVTLREIKESGLFNDWALVRQSRLSTMRAPDEFVKWMKSKRPKARI